IVRQFNGWTNIELGVEFQWRLVVTVVTRNRSNINFWTGQRREFIVTQRFLEKGIEIVIDSVFNNEAATDALIDQTWWNFALTETRDLNLVCQRFVSSIDTRFEFIKRNLNLEFDPRLGEVFDGGLDHVGLLGSNRHIYGFGTGRITYYASDSTMQSGRQDLNLRPHAPKARALPS